MSRKAKIIFTFSFLMNIIMIGVLVGGAYKHKKDVPPVGMKSETHEILKEKMREGRPRVKAHFEEVKKQKKELSSIITAPDFDQSAYDSQVKKMLSTKNIISAEKSKILGEVLSQLSQEERKEISKHVLRQLSNKPRGQKHKGRGMHSQR